MKHTLNGTVLTLWANRFIVLLLSVLIFTLPLLLDWYCLFRFLTAPERTAITAAFYACSVAVGIALWNMECLLRRILDGQVFVRKNVRCIQRIQWCCGAVGLICIPAAACYYPLVFMVIIMVFLCLVVSVVSRVMDAAVSIREENDLTI